VQKLNSVGNAFEDVEGAPLWPLTMKTFENDVTWFTNTTGQIFGQVDPGVWVKYDDGDINAVELARGPNG
jgi:hypothetical protein